MSQSYPLSPMQGSMLAATLYDQRSGSYIQQLVLRTREQLDRGAFRAACSELMRRHAILRTAFHWRDLAEPAQSVVAEATMPWVELDWRGIDPVDVEPKFERFLDEDRAAGFDLEVAPLHRFVLIRLGEEEHRVIWTYHHGLLDGRARLMVLEELFRLYEAIRDGKETQLAPEVEYRNYISWLQTQDFSRSEGHWRELLNGFTEANHVSIKREVPRRLPIAESRGQLQQWTSPQLDADLRAFAERQGVTLNTLVQAAWAILIAKYSGLEDVVFGATRSCRKSVPRGEAIVGPVINTTPVRLKVNPDTPVAEFVQELRAQHLSVREHEHTPAGLIHEWSDIPAGCPLFTTLVVFENYLLIKSKGGDWDKRVFELKEQTDHLVLAGYLADRLLLKIEYDRRWFDDDAIDRMLSQVVRVLDSMVGLAKGKLRDIQVLPESEFHRLFVEWNNTAADYPREATLAELFSAQAAETPEATAVVCRGECLSYAELEKQSNQLARVLRERGVGPGTVVALLLDRCRELAPALLGVLKVGAAYLPLDPTYPEDRLAYMIEDSRASIVLSRAAFADRLNSPNLETLKLDTNWQQVVSCQEGSPLPAIASPDDLAYLMYTSGSTGKPKGVMIPHRGVVNLCEAIKQCYRLGPEDRVLQCASISFDICVEEIYPTWHAGGTVVFRDDTRGHSMHEFIAWADREAISVFNLPTAFWNELVHGLTAAENRLPDRLRLVVVGGEKVSHPMLERWRSIPGSERVNWLNSYGPTETTVTATVYEPCRDDGSVEADTDPPIGKPIANTRVYVLDKDLTPVPIGVTGELFIGGTGVARGYLDRPELTTEVFLPDPFSGDPEARMYRTGDLVRYSSDGLLSFVGRNDHQIKISGFRIEPAEVEAAIERHSGVQQAVVKAVERSGGKYLAAFVVPLGPDPIDSQEMAAFLGETLPDHMVPSVFVSLPELPLTPGGKVDRRSLPDPEVSGPFEGEPGLPRNEGERTLLGIFEQLFPGRRIGIHDNFFELGGYSLLAFRLLTQIELQCGQRLSFAALIRCGTVEGLANLLRTPAQPESTQTHIVALQTEGAGPALFLVHGVGGSIHWYQALARMLKEDFQVYGIRSPGMEENDDEMVGADVERLARLYIDEIKGVQPRGPYCIGGHSMGGIIAFEMARQFDAQGDEVGLVANFDNWNRAADAPDLATKLWRLGRYFVKLSVTEKLRFLGDKVRWFRQEWASRRALGKEHPDAGRLDEMKVANMQAARRYVPAFYPGTLTIFRAQEQNATALDDPLLGWSGLASEIKVVEVPGNHYTLLGEPNVRTLAEELRRRLLIRAGTNTSGTQMKVV